MSDSQENAENCKLKAFEKNNYFYGKLMTVRDFVIEQQYVNNKRWLINNLLFGSGTVCGLNVSSDGKNIVVNSGFAIDNCGREIILPENVSLTLSDNDTPKTGKKAIYISYKECQKERVRAQTASTCDEVCANNRIEESYDFEIKDVSGDGSGANKEELCGIWNNHVTEDIEFNYGNDNFRFKRKTKKYVSEGDLFEIYLELTNLNNSNSSIPEITDTLPPELSLVEGSNIINGTIPFGETIKKWYVVKVNAKPPGKFVLNAKINNTPIKGESPESTIEVKFPGEISKILFDELIKFRTRPCLEGDIDSGVKIAELSLVNGSIVVDNTKRKLVNNNKFMTKMLECLRIQAEALDDQTVGIKNKLAPGNITISADSQDKDADGKEFFTITTTVKNNAGVVLPDIYVNLISTLGTLVIHNGGVTGSDGTFTATLTSTISGNATLIATTGIGTATMQIKFNSNNGNIVGYVKVKDTETIIKGATVSVGTITTTSDKDDGKFLLENVPPGKQVVWGFADGYDDGSCRVDVIEKDTINTTIFLTPISMTGEIKGSVLDIDGNVIGNNVKVTAGGITATADETGDYILSNVPAGTHTVTATADGYQTQSRSSVIVKADDTTSGIDFRLERATGTIKGVVTTSGIIRPYPLPDRELAPGSSVLPGRIIPGDFVPPIFSKGIPEALVSVVGTSLSALTDELGNYIIKNVPLGTQTVTVSASNYNASTSSALVEANKVITLNFQLTPLVTTGTVSGRVTTLRRRIVQPCVGAIPLLRTIDPIRPIDTPTVRPLDTTVIRPLDATIPRPIDTTIVRPIDPILCVSGSPSSLPLEEVGIQGAVVTVAGRSAVTDASGNYVIQNVPSGSREVSASAAGYVSKKTSILVEAGGTVTANFQLEVAVSRGTISGRVTNFKAVPLILCRAGIPADTAPAVGIKGAVVSVAGTALSAITDDSGNYTISGVPTGTYTVNASAQGYNTGTQGATVNENLTTTVNFQLVLLPTTGGIMGRVTNASGTPIVSAGINLVEVGASVITDASGTYRLSNIRPGSHTVNVSASGYISSSRTVNLIAGQTTSADFVLNKMVPCVFGRPMPDDICVAAIPRNFDTCIAARPRIAEPCTSGNPSPTQCVAAIPRNIDVPCTGATPRIVESCISGGPFTPHIVDGTDVVRPPIDRTDVVTPTIDRTDVVTPTIDRTDVVTPTIDRTDVVTPAIDRTDVVRPAIDRTDVRPAIDRTGIARTDVIMPAIDRTDVVRPTIDRTGIIRPGIDRNLATPIRGKTKPVKPKKAGETACPGGRPNIAPKQTEAKDQSQCLSGRPTIAPKSEVSKDKSSCLAGRPTIAPIKETKPQVKAKKGKKK